MLCVTTMSGKPITILNILVKVTKIYRFNLFNTNTKREVSMSQCSRHAKQYGPIIYNLVNKKLLKSRWYGRIANRQQNFRLTENKLKRNG